MNVTIVFLYRDFLYTKEIAIWNKITIGSGKKDDIYIEDLDKTQIQIENRGTKVYIHAKAPFLIKQEYSINSLIPIDQERNIAICVKRLSNELMGKFRLPYEGKVTIGRNEKNNVVILDKIVSDEHIKITVENGIARIDDMGSLNGIYLNGKRIKQAKVHSGDIISILFIRIEIINNEFLIYNTESSLRIKEIDENNENVKKIENNVEMPVYNRAPRKLHMMPSEPIILASPPVKGTKFEKSKGMWVSALGTGAMVASSIAMGVSSPAFLAARAASLISPVAHMGLQSSNNKRNERKFREYEELRKKKYGLYLQEQKAKINVIAETQKKILEEENPDSRKCLKIVNDLTNNLWERNVYDKDFLNVRMGIGYEELCVPVKSFLNENNFTLEEDEVKDLVEEIIEETRIVDYIPFRLNLLKYNQIGVIGKREKIVCGIRNLIISMTTGHFYKDVKIVGIFDEKERIEWAALRWLPHVWDDEKQNRTLTFNKYEAHMLCEQIKEIVISRNSNQENYFAKNGAVVPHYIFFIGSREYVRDEVLLNYINELSGNIGITVIYLYNEFYELPHQCQYILDLSNELVAYERERFNKRIFFSMDQNVTNEEFDDFCRRMSAIQVEEMVNNMRLPEQVTFLQGYHVGNVQDLNVLERWGNSRNQKSLQAPIGVSGGDIIFSLDLSEKKHGPHGLVAGTTGSGKSELLQTLILSLAVNHHPHKVAFILIDYKGGGMANQFEKLPHVIGTVTNLDKNIERILLSLKSELKRRQAVFEQVSKICQAVINNIEQYQDFFNRGYLNEPLPHLIIVVDEFAELKKEQPQFMKELVSISSLGRSLGIHLILATQKPAGVVDDQIWSNSKFRICLKVQDATDSREMIKRNDAALLSNPGRGYIQVGHDEVFELVQSYWSGAKYNNGENRDNTQNNVKVVLMNGKRKASVVKKKDDLLSNNELSVVIEHLHELVKMKKIKKVACPWKQELPEEITIEELRYKDEDAGKYNYKKWLKVPIGMYDLPEEQKQGIMYYDFNESGHIGIYGAPSTGKTTLLKTFIYNLALNFTPEDINLYIIDCGSWGTNVFQTMPHVGGIVLDFENEKMVKLGKILREELIRRKQKLLENRVTSLEAYRESGKNDLQAWIIAIDNFSAVFELYPDMEDIWYSLAKEGTSYGMYILYTSNSTSGIRYKVLQNIKGAIALEMNDRGDYITIVGKIGNRMLPANNGRAFMKGNPPILFQAAMFSEGKNELEKNIILQEKIDEMNLQWRGKRPKRIPIMPKQITIEEMKNNYVDRYKIPLGISYETTEVICADMNEKYVYTVTGTIGSGKSDCLKKIINIVNKSENNYNIYVFDSTKRSLRECKNSEMKYCNHKEEIEQTNMITSIVQELNVRQKQLNFARKNLDTAFSVNEFRDKWHTIYIFIDDLKEFIDLCSEANKDSMERICRYAKDLGVMVFVSGRITDLSTYNQIESLTQAIVQYQNAIALSGSALLIDFLKSNLSYNEKNTELKAQEALVYDEGKCTKIMPM